MNAVFGLIAPKHLLLGGPLELYTGLQLGELLGSFQSSIVLVMSSLSYSTIQSYPLLQGVSTPAPQVTGMGYSICQLGERGKPPGNLSGAHVLPVGKVRLCPKIQATMHLIPAHPDLDS